LSWSCGAGAEPPPELAALAGAIDISETIITTSNFMA